MDSEHDTLNGSDTELEDEEEGMDMKIVTAVMFALKSDWVKNQMLDQIHGREGNRTE